MSANPIIRSLAALSLLLLFILGSTPRQYLHDLFADHKDTMVHKTQNGEAQLSIAGFNCNTHNQVAESPFTGHTVQIMVEPPIIYPTATTQHLITNLRLQAPAVTGLRGPPAIA